MRFSIMRFSIMHFSATPTQLGVEPRGGPRSRQRTGEGVPLARTRLAAALQSSSGWTICIGESAHRIRQDAADAGPLLVGASPITGLPGQLTRQTQACRET